MSFLSSRTRSARQGFGKPVRRQEDPRLLAGQGCYSDDFNLPRQTYTCMVRSPHAHARIRRIDAADAAFRRANYVVRIETRVNGVTGVPRGPRAALVIRDETTGRDTLYAGSG